MTTPVGVYLRRRSKALVPSAEGSTDPGLVAAFDVLLRQLGYALDKDLADALLTTDQETAAVVTSSLIIEAAELRGVRDSC